MELITSPTFAYLLVVAALMLVLLTILFPESAGLKVATVLFLGAAGYELVHLEWSSWALALAALSPLPFFIAIRQTRSSPSLLIIAILLFAIGSFFLFVDQAGFPAVNYVLAGAVSIFCGEFIWLAVGREQNAQGMRLVDTPDSMVGLTGTARTEIEVHSTGLVEVEGELWTARSKTFVPSGSTVRILRRDGSVLTVKKVEKLNKE